MHEGQRWGQGGLAAPSPSKIPSSPPRTLPSSWQGYGCAMDIPFSSFLAFPCATSSVRSHSPHISGRGDGFRAISPWKVPCGPLHPTVHRVLGKQEGLDWHGGEQGTSGSCVVTRSWSPPLSKTRRLTGRCTGHGLHVRPCKNVLLCFDVGGKFLVWPGIWGAGDSNADYAW